MNMTDHGCDPRHAKNACIECQTPSDPPDKRTLALTSPSKETVRQQAQQVWPEHSIAV